MQYARWQYLPGRFPDQGRWTRLLSHWPAFKYTSLPPSSITIVVLIIIINHHHHRSNHCPQKCFWEWIQPLPQLRPNNHSAKIISRLTTCRIQNFTILWELLSISISIHLSAEVNIGVNPATYNDIDWYTSVNINWYTSIHIYTNLYKDVVDIEF